MEEPSSIILYLIAVPVLLLIHSFFVLVSSALLHARKKKLEGEEFKVPYGKNRAIRMLNSAEQDSLSAQAGRFMVFLGLVFVMIKIIESDWLMQLFPVGSFGDYLVNLLFILLTIVLALVLVQISWAVSYAIPEKTLCYMAPIAFPILYALAPFGYLAHWISEFFNKKFSLPSPVESQQNVTVDDIAELVDLSDESEKDADELSMLKGVVDLDQTKVEEVMTPRQDVISIPIDIELSEAIQLIKQAEFSRLVVIDESLDEVKGLLLVKDLIKLVGLDLPDQKFSAFVRPLISVSGKENLLNLLGIFRAESAHLAVVMDEHGGVDGIVTMEDVLEEIVGEIFDEHDDPTEDQDYKMTLSGDLLIDGGALIDDLNQEYNLELPLGEYDTIAGFIIDQLGKMPSNGEVIRYNGFKLVVEDFSDNRINQVRLIAK